MSASEYARWMRQGDITSSLRLIKDLMDSGDLTTVLNSRRIAASTVFFINLNDLLQKAREDGKEVSLAEPVSGAGVTSITDLVSKCRNGACHISSAMHILDTNKVTWNFVLGRGTGLRSATFEQTCEYADDAAVFVGEYRFYLRRHGMAALIELIKLYPECATKGGLALGRADSAGG